MANRERGELLLRGVEGTFTLRLSASSCCELETLTEGRTLEQLIAGVNKGLMRDIRLLAWAALRDRHADVAAFSGVGLVAVGNVIDQCGGAMRVVDHLRALVDLNARPARKARPKGDKRPSEPPKRTWRDLYISALANGVSPETFWSLSLRELWNVQEAEEDRDLRAYNRDVTLAWQVERLTIMARKSDGSRKLPALKDLILRANQDDGPRRPRTREEQRLVIHAMSAAMGIPVQRLKKKANGQYDVIKEPGSGTGKRNSQTRR